MNVIKLSIDKPIAVISAVIMVLIFGWVSLERIPIQMAPDVTRPVINVTTKWPGAAPSEIEREIINLQEDVLKGIDGLERIEGTARSNQGNIELEFAVGADMSRALLLVANRLDLISGYPDEVNQPVLSTSGTEDNAIAWFSIMQMPDVVNNNSLSSHGNIIDKFIREKIERVEGISSLNANGQSDREMRVVFDPVKLAKYSLTVSEVIRIIRNANASITGGDVNEGKRRYIVRTQGNLVTPDQVKNIILRSRSVNGSVSRVAVGDIADVNLVFKERKAIARRFGEPTMTMSVTREPGSNVIETMKRLKIAVSELANGPLKKLGIVIVQLYDETDYINSAISLVLQNIIVGGSLAVLILLVFLRSWQATLVIALSIPVSVIGSFVAMAFLGRSLNVVSLAGIAFAVGMVVDAAIVVLENIFRHHQDGIGRKKAAYLGTSQVWPAVFVSALTTVMVFIPILIMELEAGQLFRDIAVAISVSVILSLLVSITLIPALSNSLLNEDSSKKFYKIFILDNFAKAFTFFWIKFSLLVVKKKYIAISTISCITFLAIIFTILFIPKLDYLPTGNRNFVFGFVQTPPGYNLATTNKITENIENSLKPYWAIKENKNKNEKNGKPTINSFFTVALEGRAFMGASSTDYKRASELIPMMQNPANSEPGTRAYMFQPSLFGRSVGGGRSIDLDISGPDLEVVIETAKEAFSKVINLFPFREGHRTRPKPGLELGAPEIRILPDQILLSDNGLSTTDLGLSVDVFNDGLRVAELSLGNERVDLTLAGKDINKKTTQSIASLPVVASNGRIMTVNSLAEVIVTTGPTQIRRVEGERTVTLSITPAQNIPLQKAIEIVKSNVIEPMEKEGLASGVKFNLSGTADKLTKTWNELVIDLILALIIVYLVMAVLFESFIYPFIILLSVPVAAAGGLAGLSILNIWVQQSLDMLTILGFVILIGIVVNNAILLVHQTLYNIRKLNLDSESAIIQATKNRVRPIFMSTLTSLFGMLPLVLFPGSGSELYRGLGSVVVGGLGLSAILTMALVPPMLSLTVDLIEKKV